MNNRSGAEIKKNIKVESDIRYSLPLLLIRTVHILFFIYYLFIFKVKHES